jgi:hypothetical protein
MRRYDTQRSKKIPGRIQGIKTVTVIRRIFNTFIDDGCLNALLPLAS